MNSGFAGDGEADESQMDQSQAVGSQTQDSQLEDSELGEAGLEESEAVTFEDEEPIEAPHTGDDVVDTVIAQVRQGIRGTLDEHVQVIDQAHRTLQDRLADVEG